MYAVIYTKSLDNANEMVAKSYEYESKDDAIKLFNEYVLKVLNEALENEYLNCKMSITQHKALIKIEDTHYCIAVMLDEDLLKHEE